MKKIILSALILGSIISCSNNDKVVDPKKDAKQEVKQMNSNNPIDLESSTVFWKGTKAIGGGHHGTVKFSDGTLDYENDVFKGGTFTVDMQSIACLDIKDKDSNADLVGHLKSEDFFAVDEFPTAKVVVSNAQPLEGNRYKCLAHIELKNKEKKMEIEVSSQMKGSKHVLVGKMMLDRTEFGVVYNSANFFKALGDRVIDDEMMIKFEIVQK